MRGTNIFPLWHGHFHRLQKLPERKKLFTRRCVMRPVNERDFFCFKCFGCADICLDHAFFDQAHGFYTVCDVDISDAALFVQADFIFREIEMQRAAVVASFAHHLIGRPQWFENLFKNGSRGVIRLPIDGTLRLLVA